MAPLDDFECLLRAFYQDGGTEHGRSRGGAGRRDEFAPIHPFPPGHCFTLHSFGETARRGAWGLAPAWEKAALSERVHNAPGAVTCVLLTRRRPPRGGAEIL